VASLGRMLEHVSGGAGGEGGGGASCASFDTRTGGNVLLNYLPMKGDKTEAKICHEQLVRMVEASQPDILGDHNANLPHVVRIFAQVLTAGDELATAPVRERMSRLLQQMSQVIPPEVFTKAGAALDETQRTNLQAACAGHHESIKVVKLK